MVEIVQDGTPVLRNIAEAVMKEEFGTPELQTILTNMDNALASQDDGVAIAAPQIAVPKRIFIVSPKVWALQDESPETKKPKPTDTPKHRIFINPRITKQSSKTLMMEEGCLSVRWKYGKVRRSKQATITAQDEHGITFTLGASGLLAQIFQHEVDHLDGVLFIDKAVEVVDIPPEKHAAQ